MPPMETPLTQMLFGWSQPTWSSSSMTSLAISLVLYNPLGPVLSSSSVRPLAIWWTDGLGVADASVVKDEDAVAR